MDVFEKLDRILERAKLKESRAYDPKKPDIGRRSQTKFPPKPAQRFKDIGGKPHVSTQKQSGGWGPWEPVK